MKRFISVMVSVMMILSICNIVTVFAKADESTSHHEGDTVAVTYTINSDVEIGGVNFEIYYNDNVFYLQNYIEEVSESNGNYSIVVNDDKLGKIIVDLIRTDYTSDLLEPDILSIKFNFKALKDFDSGMMGFDSKTNLVVDYKAYDIPYDQYIDSLNTKIYCQYSSDTDSESETDTANDSDTETDTETITDTADDSDTETDTTTDTETVIPNDSDTETNTTDDSDTETETDISTDSDKGNDDTVLYDINGDGKFSLKDASLVQKYYMGLADLTAEQLEAADVNGDGKVNLLDAYLLQIKLNELFRI